MPLLELNSGSDNVKSQLDIRSRSLTPDKDLGGYKKPDDVIKVKSRTGSSNL
jgi:hypothetical protein